MWVPTNPDAIARELMAGLIECVSAARLLVDRGVTWAEEEDFAEAFAALLIEADEAGSVVAVAPAFGAACGLVQMVINDLLPQFVTESYWVAVNPRPVSAWGSAAPVACGPTQRQSSGLTGRLAAQRSCA